MRPDWIAHYFNYKVFPKWGDMILLRVTSLIPPNQMTLQCSTLSDIFCTAEREGVCSQPNGYCFVEGVHHLRMLQGDPASLLSPYLWDSNPTLDAMQVERFYLQKFAEVKAESDSLIKLMDAKATLRARDFS